MAKTNKDGLGKGFGALLGESLGEDAVQEGISTLPMALVEPNPAQPRKVFDRDAMEALKQSIATHGIITPITVRMGADGYYQIIAGERRWRAARSVGLTEIPAMVIEANDSQVMELALIENLQREDLNPIEEAEGYDVLIRQYGMTQEQVADSVGKSRPAISNALRLLALPQPAREMVAAGGLSPGHARAILAIQDPDLRLEAIESMAKMSVRQAENYARQVNQQKKQADLQQAGFSVNYLEVSARELENHLGRKVRIEQGKKSGTVTLEFYGADDLQRLIEALERLNV